jgi:hypothetical protein
LHEDKGVTETVELRLKNGAHTELHPDHVKGKCATPGCTEPSAHWTNKDGFLAFLCCDCWKLKRA